MHALFVAVVLLAGAPIARDVVVTRLLEDGAATAIDFDVTLGDPIGDLVPIELSVPVEQFRFADDGTELVAKVSVLTSTESPRGRSIRAIRDAHRLTAPRGAAPHGVVTFRFDVLTPRRGTRMSIVVFDENAQVAGARPLADTNGVVSDPTDDPSWRELLARAQREKKPIVVFFRPPVCARCRDFERVTVAHPAIQRRLPAVLFATLPTNDDPGVGLFDRSGVLRVRWPNVPGTTTFGMILDSAVTVAPHFERAVQLAESNAPHDGEIEVAVGLARLGRNTEARAALARARAEGSLETQQAATVAAAVLDARDGKGAEALAELEKVVSSAVSPRITADAWIAIGGIHRSSGATENAIRAFEAAAGIADAGSPAHAAAGQALAALTAVRGSGGSGAIRILLLGRQVVTGRHVVKTNVAAASIASVSFSLDGREVARAERPPFSATLDFGDAPERRSIRVAAFDRKGHEIGRDERIVNDAGETFRLRLVEPRGGSVAGAVRVAMSVRTPAAYRLQRVVVSWNDAERAVLTAPPWEASIEIPRDQAGVLRAVAELEDGRISEDAVLLNAKGMVERSDVQLVELPITVMSRDGSIPEITADRISVREGKKRRVVESVATAAETPLTIGLLIDASDSVHSTLADVQEAAIRFLETTLGERDRAFLITFDSHARLVQPATQDVALLRRQIMRIRADGLTALHDAMVLGLLQFEGIKGRRAMIVFSDGGDRMSSYGAAEVRELARRMNVPIHVIASLEGVPARLNATGTPSGAAWDAATGELRRVAGSTGGTSHLLDDLGGLPRVYSRIEAALRAQILAFIRTEPATTENEWRGIHVALAGADLDVYAPEGYYASW